MEIIKEILFVGTFAFVFCFASWVLYRLAKGDVLKLYHWSRNICIVMLLISIIIWISQKVFFIKLSSDKTDMTFLVIFNLIFLLITQLSKWLINKSKKRLIEDYMIPRLMMIFTISTLVVPILNIYFIIL